MNEFQEKFIEEAGELIGGIEAELLALESNPDDKTIIDKVFRVMHTLKGTASMFGFEKIESITHHLETIYDQIRDDEISISADIIGVTFDTVDIIKKILDNRNQLDEADQQKFEEILHEIMIITGTEEKPSAEENNLKKSKTSQKATPSLYYIFYQPDENIYLRGIMPFSIFYELSELGTFRAVPNLDRIPKPEDFDPDIFYLKWDIFLYAEASTEDVEDVFLFFDEEEYKVLPIESAHIEGTDFLREYNKIRSKRLSTKEMQTIMDEIYGGEKHEVERPGMVKPREGEADEENVLHDLVENSKSISKKISSLRVSADKLDQLIVNVSEFVTLYSQIDLLSKNSENKQLSKSIQSLGKLSKKLRDTALELRLVPIHELALKMHRLIRDLSKKLGKEINFFTEGTETELDKTIIDNLEEPLMHIIRNSLDHGIEDLETRLENDKTAKGIVRMTAFHSGAYVFIQIQDDGRGIDTERVMDKAIEKGLIPRDAKLTERECYNLLFTPGFTTAENISKVSGRGVGMDVVKQKINELRGEIEIDSELGLGTSVTIKLPLTLSIIDTLRVKVGGLMCLIPLANVETCLRVPYKEITAGVKRQYEYQNVLLPVIMLREELQIEGELPVDGRIVIIQQYEKKYSLMVDEVLGDHQAVVKPLGDLHKKHDFFSGASIMGDGSLALILDTNKMVNLNKEMQIVS